MGADDTNSKNDTQQGLNDDQKGQWFVLHYALKMVTTQGVLESNHWKWSLCIWESKTNNTQKGFKNELGKQ